MSILWIILIVVLVLVLLGFFEPGAVLKAETRRRLSRTGRRQTHRLA